MSTPERRRAAMPPLYLFDDARARTFEPFALTRPVSELRAGAELIRRRWERCFGAEAAGFVAGEHLTDFEEAGAPRWANAIPAGAIVANSRCAIALDARAERADGVSTWRCGGRVAAVRVGSGMSADDLARANDLAGLASSEGGEGAAADLAGRWLDEVWDLVGQLDDQVTDDVLALAGGASAATLARVPDGVTVLGDHPVRVEEGAAIEPLVVLDATAGPILIRRGARVAAFTRISGPSVIGEDATILGGRLASVAIGERCKVHGEVSHTVFLGYANKSHDGFVGHSYVGRWANLGAGTITSNLKNTYGTVQLWTPGGVRDTGLRFFGTLFGDHAKTGIGTTLTTGCVLGAGANVFGGATPPKAVPPFAWGDEAPYDVFDIERFLTVAERVMRRRDVMLGERARRQLAAAHAGRWSPEQHR